MTGPASQDMLLTQISPGVMAHPMGGWRFDGGFDLERCFSSFAFLSTR